VLQALLIAAVMACWLGPTRRSASMLGAFVAGLACMLSPVVLRNLVVGAPALKLAVTGGTVYCVFNAAGSNPHFFEVPRADLGPLIASSGGTTWGAVRACLESFHGDVVGLIGFYARKGLGLVVPYENPDNASFYYACLKSPLLRALPDYSLLLPLFLFGLLLARPRNLVPLVPAAASLFVSIAITLALSRYRATFAALMVPLAGVACARLALLARERRIGRLALAAAAFLGSFAATRLLQERIVFGGRPPARYYYRPAEFTLVSGIHERAGRHLKAAAEMLELARLHPDAPVRRGALLGAARLQARAGAGREVRATLDALLSEPGVDAGTLLAVGDAYRDLLQDAARALDCYQRAERLLPGGALAEALRERVRALTPPRRG
jgi:hypothetical protein